VGFLRVRGGGGRAVESLRSYPQQDNDHGAN
jgi:hypothetical protein